MRSKLSFITLVSGVVLFAGAANAQQVATGNNFTVNANVAACSANADCKIDLKLEAKGDFHVNKEYPYKFKATAANGVTFLGKDAAGADTFSKTAGDFTLDSGNEKLGTMTIKFKPASKGGHHRGRLQAERVLRAELPARNRERVDPRHGSLKLTPSRREASGRALRCRSGPT